jgi:2-oxo-4-hydroxy-4-carboxy-5-ureidoimidazoline decarboxylase
MSDVLMRWNRAPAEEAENDILPCCGSRSWAREMVARRPLPDESALLKASEETCRTLSEADWTEAFSRHPRIGESRTEQPTHARSARWSAREQRDVAAGNDETKIALAEANLEYERKFGRIFIVCATGKSACEIVAILQRRLQNDARTELFESVEQQRQITQLRLKKWLQA